MTIAPEVSAQILRLHEVERWRVGTIARAATHLDLVPRRCLQLLDDRGDRVDGAARGIGIGGDTGFEREDAPLVAAVLQRERTMERGEGLAGREISTIVGMEARQQRGRPLLRARRRQRLAQPEHGVDTDLQRAFSGAAVGLHRHEHEPLRANPRQCAGHRRQGHRQSDGHDPLGGHAAALLAA